MALGYLFAPAHEARKVARALDSASDAVILDLEDSVPDSQKMAARDAVVRASAGRDLRASELWVRVNDSASSHFEADVDAIDFTALTGVVVPKAEQPDALARLRQAGAARLLLLIESVAGFDRLPELVRAGGVERVAIGTWDLACDLGIVAVEDPDESDLIWQLRGELVVASRRLALQPPIDGIYARLHDEEGFRAACVRAARIGLGGKLLIHPEQVATAHDVFGATGQRIELARQILQAYEEGIEQGRGAVTVGGRAVDRPMAVRARALLARWEAGAR